MTANPSFEPDADLWVLAFQQVANRTITLSVTRRCPLSCAHCITSSSRSPELGMLTSELAARWADEMPRLAAAGVRHLTFTGGEPTLCAAAVAEIAERAAAVGIDTAVVSSGAFATTTAAADRMVSRLSAVARWDLGYDEYHAEHLGLDVFARAVDAVTRRGRPCVVRVCEGADAMVTAALVERVRAVCPAGTEIIRQPVRALGRAVSLPTRRRSQSSPTPHLPAMPCISSGLQVQHDGTASPCCAGLSNSTAAEHPFRLANATGADGLSGAWASWHTDQLLRVIRLLGFAPVLHWLIDSGYDVSSIPSAADVCEFCVQLWSDPDAQRIARRRADDEAIAERLDLVEALLVRGAST